MFRTALLCVLDCLFADCYVAFFNEISYMFCVAFIKTYECFYVVLPYLSRVSNIHSFILVFVLRNKTNMAEK